MAFFVDTPTNRGVRQDFPLRNAMKINSVNIRSGILKPTKSVITHPDLLFDMLDVNITTASTPRVGSQSFINGYFFSSVALSANRTITTPTAVEFLNFLARELGVVNTTTNLAGVRFEFTIDNDQAGAFTRTLIGGVGVTLQGSGFDLAQNEIGVFHFVAHDNNEVIISRSNQGSSGVETLGETLAAGNITAGTDIVITIGDSITGTGTVPITSSKAAADAVTITASAGGIDILGALAAVNAVDIDAPDGGISITGGLAAVNAVDIDAPSGGIDIATGGAGATGDFLVTAVSASVVLTGGEAVADAVQLTASNAAGGVAVTAGTGGINLGGTGSLFLSGTSLQTLTGNDQTIDTTLPIRKVTAGAARTGTILEAGTSDGQIFILLKIDAAANSITFNTTPATANVAGTDVAGQDTLTAIGSYLFVWNATDSLWYACSTASFS